jgi:putative membrane protein
MIAIFAGVVAAGLGVLSVVTSFDASMIVNQLGFLNEFIILLVGIVAVSAMIVPGISGSMLLLVIGFYAPITNLIRDLLSVFSSTGISSVLVPIVVLGVFAIGLAIGFVIISLLMKFLLSKYKAATYFGILGFIIGSLVSLYYNYEVVWMYGFSPWWHYLIAAFLFIGGIAISYTLVRYGKKKDDKEIAS